MDTNRAVRLAESKLKEHGLHEWRVVLDNAKSRMGICRHRMKTIGLSKPVVELNKEETILDTILHEIAHAIVGARHGHNSIWKRKAREIGSSGERCVDAHSIVVPKGKYVGVCKNCGSKSYRQRKATGRMSCSKCAQFRGFDESRLIEWSLAS